MKHLARHYPVVLNIIIGLFIWEIYVLYSKTPIWILPAPTDIALALYQERATILSHAFVTIYEAILGFSLAFIVSLLLAIMIDSNEFFKRGFYPILVTSQTIPIIAIAPLLTIWFGFGILPKVLIVALVGFFPIVISFVDGLNSADEGLIALLKTMNATKWQILKKVKFPSAMPSMFSGLRIAATYSIMGAVIGEWLGASKGLGLYMKTTAHSFSTDKVFAAIIVIVTTSILLYALLLILENRIIAWNKRSKKN